MLGLTKANKSSSDADAYSETLYRDLVHNESKRSERSGHLCRSLLVYRTNARGQVVHLGSELTSKIISVLSMSIRDTDYIGWHRQGWMLGILLTGLRPDSARNGWGDLNARLVSSLRGAVGFTDDHSFQIRVLEQGELTTFNASDHPAPFPGSND